MEIIIVLVVLNCFFLIKCFIFDCFFYEIFKWFKIIVCKINLLDKIVKLCLIVYNIFICFVILIWFFINYYICKNKLYFWWSRVEFKYLWICMKGLIKFNIKEFKRYFKENCFSKVRIDIIWIFIGILVFSFVFWYLCKFLFSC